MISVKTVLESILMNLEQEGNILSLDVKTDDEYTPFEITIRSTQHVSQEEEELVELIITETGYSKRVIGKIE